MDDPKARAYCFLHTLKQHYLMKVKLSTNKGGMDPGVLFLMKHTKPSRNLDIDLVSLPFAALWYHTLHTEYCMMYYYCTVVE
jgi:hypothetical protein